MVFKMQDSYKKLDIVQDYIINKIRNNELKTGSILPSIRNISKSLETSSTTVSTALKKLVRQGWLSQDKNKNYYVSNRVFDLLLPNKKLKVAFTSRGFKNIHTPNYQSVFFDLSKLAMEKGILIDCILEFDNSVKDKTNIRYDALILSDWQPENCRNICSNTLIGLEYHHEKETDYIIHYDQFHGGELIAQHLYSLGYKKVTYFDALVDDKLQNLRRVGFLNGWVNCGGSLSQINILPIIPPLKSERNWASENDKETIKSQVIKESKKADVFFVFCDMWAIEICNILKSHNIKIPDDIGVAGFDGILEALSYDPPLTTVRQDSRMLAEKIIETIVTTTFCKKELPHKIIIAGAELVPGKSTSRKT